MTEGQRWMCLFLLLFPLGLHYCSSTSSVPTVNTRNIEECICSNFINAHGYGQCKKEARSFGGYAVCYVNLPSTCNDLKESKTNPGKFVSASACGFVVSGRNGRKKWGEECQQPCSGQRCEQLAEMMRFLVDFSVNPCDDFFSFACSAPIAKTETVDFEDLVKFPPKGFEYVQKFYLSCTRIDTGYSTEEVFAKCFEDGKCEEEELQKYGDIFAQFLRYTHQFINKTMLPAVTPDWEEVTGDMFGGQGWNWWDFAALGFKDFFYLEAFNMVEKDDYERTQDVFRSNVFFAPMIDTTAESTSLDLHPNIHIVPMSIPENLGNGDVDYLTKYKALMKGFFTNFGGDAVTIDDDVEKILNMELQVGRINNKEWFSTGFSRKYEFFQNQTNDTDCYDYDYYVYINATKSDFNETITIIELYDLVPSVEWKDYIEGAFRHNPNFKVTRSTKVKIPSPKLMTEIGEWVENLSSRDQANLLIWRMFIKFANDFMHTGSDIRDLQQDLFTPVNETITRPENCIVQIKTFFPHAHDDMFIAKYVDESTRNTIKTMFKELAMEFEQIIEETDWMSSKTQIRAKEKIKAMKIITGELSPNTPEFRELKEQMSSQDYIGNILAIGNYNWDTLAKNINNEKEVRKYPADTVNAVYDPQHNQVKILAGLIVQPFYGLHFALDIPASLVYGGFVSTTLGHEMIHGFDNTGKMYDKDGFRLNWWKPSEDKTYLKKTQCLIDQYANFTIPYNGVVYQIPCTSYPPNENIADNGGVKAAYRSYQRLQMHLKECMPDPDLPFTSDQLFWLGHAFGWCISSHHKTQNYTSLLNTVPDHEGHYPAPWRVNTVLANQPEFAAAFKCPLGSRLNPRPEDRCTIW